MMISMLFRNDHTNVPSVAEDLQPQEICEITLIPTPIVGRTNAIVVEEASLNIIN